ncbi:cytochrome P450 4T8 isoform X2 [Sparus aurata]|nr:cytochrome P450 4A6-like isoform X2 [Sparus aurata]
MSDSTKTMLDKWESYANTDKSFELFEHVSLMTLDSILKCAFSHNSNCQTEGGTNAYIKAVYELSNLINLRFRTFPYHSDLIFYLSPHGYRHRKACSVTHSHTREVIRKRKEALKEEKELDRIQAKRNLDFLDILLLARDENQQGLSDEDIRAEVDTFMFEGHDTTASGLSFILYSLACHPEHQKMCREEIMQALEGKDTMEWEDLSKIPYTTMCIKESLRLYPPVPGMNRKTTKPITFFDGRTLPAGSFVGTSVYGIHRNAAVWENPDVFDPLRFLPENTSRRSPHAFVPFSAGPRNCIGQNFAMNELKVATALTLKKYELIEDPTCKPKIIPRLVLRSLNGIHIKIRSVEPNM